METQYTYSHTCQHIAHGPILSNPLIYLPLLTHTRSYSIPPPNSYHIPSPNNLRLQKLHLSLDFPCPFCADPNLHTLVSAGDGVLVIMGSGEGGSESESEVSEFSSCSEGCRDSPSASSFPSYSSSFSSRHFVLPPQPSSFSSFSAFEKEFLDTWKVLKICGVEDIKSSEWAQGINVSTSPKECKKENFTNQWLEHRRSPPRESRWTPMAWIPRPVGNIQTLPSSSNSSDTNSTNESFHSFTNSRFPPTPHTSITNNQEIRISQSWRGSTGEDANGYGWRGRILTQSRLPGMMSELGALLRDREFVSSVYSRREGSRW